MCLGSPWHSIHTDFDVYFDRLAWNELIMTRKVTRKVPSHHAAKSADFLFCLVFAGPGGGFGGPGGGFRLNRRSSGFATTFTTN